MSWFRKDKIAEAQKRLMDYWKDGKKSYLCMCPSNDGGLVSCCLDQLTIWNRRDRARIAICFEPEQEETTSQCLKCNGFYDLKIASACELWPRGITREYVINSCEAKAGFHVDYFFRNEGLLPSDKTVELIRSIEFLMRFSFNSYVF